MSISSTSGTLTEYRDEKSSRAKPTYSRIRTSLLKLTPGDSKCRLYCKGVICKYCNIAKSGEPQAIDGLNSSWVTTSILAMSRLLPAHFEHNHIIDEFIKHGIRSIINLQEPMEHAYCGHGVGPSGFSYEPEQLMRHDIYHYNFQLPDFEACSAIRLLDIVKVIDYATTIGKVAVHCHAGKGRTGMVIAATLMYRNGLPPDKAVATVRKERPGSIQSIEQVTTLNNFHKLLIYHGGRLVPPQKFTSILQYVNYNTFFLAKVERQSLGLIPKIVHNCVILILKRFYKRIDIQVTSPSIERHRIEFNCSGSLVEGQGPWVPWSNDMKNVISFYRSRTLGGMNIINCDDHFSNLPLHMLCGLLSYFFSGTFEPFGTREEIVRWLQSSRDDFDSTVDYAWCFAFILSAFRRLPQRTREGISLWVASWMRCAADNALADDVKEHLAWRGSGQKCEEQSIEKMI